MLLLDWSAVDGPRLRVKGTQGERERGRERGEGRGREGVKERDGVKDLYGVMERCESAWKLRTARKRK